MNAQMEECKDRVGFSVEGEGLGLPKSPVQLQASSPLFEEVDADSPFPGDWFAFHALKCLDVLYCSHNY